MCLVSLCIQDAPLCICLVLTHFCFSLSGGRQCNPAWTKTFKGCIIQDFSPMYFAIYLQCAVTKNLHQVILLYFCSVQWPKTWIELVGFVFDSVLCTTDWHRGKQCPGEFSSVPTLIKLHLLEVKDWWWGQWSLQVFVQFWIWGCITNINNP